MAKVTYGPTVNDARGKVGDAVFTRARGGNVARALSLAAAGVGPHNLLSSTHPDTVPATPPARGSIITGQNVATAWAKLTLGANGKFLGSDGTDAGWLDLPPPAYPGTGEIAISQVAQPASLNLTTEGTNDWATGGALTTVHRQLPSTSLHRKMLGGWLFLAFDWQMGPATLLHQASTIMLSCTAADNVNGTALNNYQGDNGLYCATPAAVGFGFCLRSPATTTSRTLKLYASVYSGIITLTCRLSDGSHADASDTLESPAATTALTQWNIVYAAAHDGADLTLQVVLTTNKGSTPNVKFQAATLA